MKPEIINDGGRMREMFDATEVRDTIDALTKPTMTDNTARAEFEQDKVPCPECGGFVNSEVHRHHLRQLARTHDPFICCRDHAVDARPSGLLREALEWALRYVPKFTDDDHGTDPEMYRKALAALAAATGGQE